MSNIEPMLFQEVSDKEEVLGKEGYGYERKENGIRAICHIKNHKIVGVHGRNNAPILYLFPELDTLKLPWKEAIIDSEICVFKGDKSVYYGGIDSRRSRKSITEIETLEKNGKVLKLVVFDALKIDNEILINKPYSYRYDKIKVIPEAKNITVSKLYFDGNKLWEEVIKNDYEGLIAKNLSGIYELGKRSSTNLKLKNYKPAELTVEKFEENDKGMEVYGTAKLRDGTEVKDVSCQFHNFETVKAGETLMIKYLEMIEGKEGTRITQPTKLTSEQYKKLK